MPGPLSGLKVQLTGARHYIVDALATQKYESLYQTDEIAGIQQQSVRRARSGLRLRSSSCRLGCLIVFLTVILVTTALKVRAQVHISAQRKAWEARPWTRFPRENDYYNGLHGREGTNQNHQHSSSQHSSHRGDSKARPTPFIYWPYHSRLDSDVPPAQDCLLDVENEVPAPLIWAYSDLPQRSPQPLLGSYDLFKVRKDVCFERYGRYASYGLGYEVDRGGAGLGMHGDMDGTQTQSNMEWQIDWRHIDLGGAQKHCQIRNEHRFIKLHAHQGKVMKSGLWPESTRRGTKNSTASDIGGPGPHLPRACVVLRVWGDYRYTEYTRLYIRSLVSELNLNSGAEYDVHLLVHIKDRSKPIWTSEKAYDEVLEATVPAEFRSMASLWSEDLMRLIYPGPFEPQFAHHGPIHSVARSMHMALQWFGMQHPEYEYFWNWEMDLRYIGHYYELFDRVANWAKQQPRRGLWERSGRFYIPSFHGNWSSFCDITRNQTQNATNTTVFEPEVFPESGIDNIGSSLPGPDEDLKHPYLRESTASWGVGEDADYITFNPMFDPEGTDWVYRNDVSGYDTNLPIPPRRASIITASRLSRRLLSRMHQETYLGRHSMASEMFPASMALHHGFKAVFVPHAVYFDRGWPPDYANSVFNGGLNGASGGYRESVFSEYPQHNFQGATFYYNSGFAGALWRRWLGYRENNEGGAQEEVDGSSGGRMCVKSMLLHPIKWEEGEIE